MPSLLHLTIRSRLLLLGFFSIGSTLLLVLVLGTMLTQIEHLKDGQSLLQQAENQVLKLRQFEKDFANGRDLAQVSAYEESFSVLQQQLQALEPYAQEVGLSSRLQEMQQLKARYGERFRATVSQYQQIGLTQSEGLRGALRKAVHGAESRVRELEQDHLLVSILMLRRHEKDFLLRHQVKYLQRFNGEIDNLLERIDSSPVVALQSDEISTSLQQYRREFANLVNSWQTLGLQGGDGIRGEMARTATELERNTAELVTQFTRRLTEEIEQIHQIILLVSVVTTLVVLILLTLIGNSVLRPLREVTALVRTLCSREGDLTMRLNFQHKDELGALADNIDLFIAKIHRIVTQIAERVGVVTDSAQQGAAIAEQTNQGVSRQHGEIEQMSGAIHEMANTASGVAGHASSAAELAADARQRVEESERSMEASVAGIRALTGEVNNASDVLSQLAEDSRNISSIVSVIRDVSEQTNLLALNAAIEAARAGEQGRGFAVVADEVRSLAVKTHDSTEQINDFIRQLQERSEHAVTVMQRGTDQSVLCIEQSEHAARELEQVVEAISSINRITGQILEGASDQQAVADNLDRSMCNMKDVAQEVAEGARQTNEDSLHLNNLAAELTHQVGKFRF
ncbi:MAG: methyl-accepting chemotaxis protein [Marinobacterium sp.]|nr:methyl-accepting chemotaxis protein [Marinobacterium sp.]